MLHAVPHVPAVHAGEPLGRVGHTVGQLPQCKTLVTVFVSQPSLAIALQSPRPAVHAIPHAPALHAGAAPVRVGQTLAQVPQFAVEVRRFVSQPFVGMASQLPKFMSQLKPHTLALHVGRALARAEQTVLHAPQFDTSVMMSTHDRPAPQTIWPAGQLVLHVPDEQTSVAAHALPHAPQ